MRIRRLPRLPMQCVFLLLASAAHADQHAAVPMDPHQHHASAEAASLFRPVKPPAPPGSQTKRRWRGGNANRHGWDLMLHGNVLAQLLYEPGDRHRTGGFATTQPSSVNWGMAMARRHVGAARVGVRTMLSLEPWTVSDCGFINLLATGERCEGDTIHDRQHPHDLFMELAADYDRPLRGSLRLQLYGGLAGEPALGPVGFPHRRSSLPNPADRAPLAGLDARDVRRDHRCALPASPCSSRPGTCATPRRSSAASRRPTSLG